MPGAWTALVASTLLGAAGARYEVGGMLQAAYGTDWESLESVKGTQFELVPRLSLAFGDTSLDLRLAYDPRILMGASGTAPTVLHRALLSLDVRPSRAVRIGLLLLGSYGTNNFRAQSVTLPPAPGTGGGTATGTGGGTGAPSTGSTPEAPPPAAVPPPGPVQPLPVVATATYLDTSATLGLDVGFSATLGMSASLSYVARGGADAQSRVAVPVQRGPSAVVGLDWRPRKDHRLGTSLSATYYSFLSEPPATVVKDSWSSQLVEAWEHTYGPRRVLRLGLGVGATGNAASFSDLVARNVAPVAEGSWAPGGEFRLGARYGPAIDFTTGLSAQRVEASVAFATSLARAWDMNANVVAAEVVSGPQREQIMGTAQLAAGFQPERQLRFFLGLLGVWQRPGPYYPGATVRQVSLALGIDFREAGTL